MIFDELEYGKFAGVTSVITLMELLVKPIALSNPERVAEYEGLLRDYPHLTIAEITQTIARRAAKLRARYRLRPPDAMTLAAVLENGATAFITNDLALRRVREIEIIALNDYAESDK
jgi:predicted nucleic acid-binding protein